MTKNIVNLEDWKIKKLEESVIDEFSIFSDPQHILDEFDANKPNDIRDALHWIYVTLDKFNERLHKLEKEKQDVKIK